MASQRRAKTLSPDNQTARFLYTILKQLDLKTVDWNEVAGSLDITNGHAARMRYSRFKSQIEGLSVQSRTPKRRREPRAGATATVSSSTDKFQRIREEEEERRSFKRGGSNGGFFNGQSAEEGSETRKRTKLEQDYFFNPNHRSIPESEIGLSSLYIKQDPDRTAIGTNTTTQPTVKREAATAEADCPLGSGMIDVGSHDYPIPSEGQPDTRIGNPSDHPSTTNYPFFSQAQTYSTRPSSYMDMHLASSPLQPAQSGNATTPGSTWSGYHPPTQHHSLYNQSQSNPGWHSWSASAGLGHNTNGPSIPRGSSRLKHPLSASVQSQNEYINAPFQSGYSVDSFQAQAAHQFQHQPQPGVQSHPRFQSQVQPQPRPSYQAQAQPSLQVPNEEPSFSFLLHEADVPIDNHCFLSAAVSPAVSRTSARASNVPPSLTDSATTTVSSALVPLSFPARATPSDTTLSLPTSAPTPIPISMPASASASFPAPATTTTSKTRPAVATDDSTRYVQGHHPTTAVTTTPKIKREDGDEIGKEGQCEGGESQERPDSNPILSSIPLQPAGTNYPFHHSSVGTAPDTHRSNDVGLNWESGQPSIPHADRKLMPDLDRSGNGSPNTDVVIRKEKSDRDNNEGEDKDDDDDDVQIVIKEERS